MKSDQILQQHFAANQIFLSASLQVCLLMSVGRSPTYRSLTFPASTHSLAMWAGAALHQKRCKSNSKSIDEQQSLKKKENFLDYAPTIATTWLHSSSAKQLQQLRCAAHQGAIIFAQHPRLGHFSLSPVGILMVSLANALAKKSCSARDLKWHAQ